LQGFHEWFEGDLERLSTTRFHSAGGRIWDIVRESDELRALAAALLRALAGEER